MLPWAPVLAPRGNLAPVAAVTLDPLQCVVVSEAAAKLGVPGLPGAAPRVLTQHPPHHLPAAAGLRWAAPLESLLAVRRRRPRWAVELTAASLARYGARRLVQRRWWRSGEP